MARMNLWLWLSKNLGRAFWEEAIEELDDELQKERSESKKEKEKLLAVIESKNERISEIEEDYQREKECATGYMHDWQTADSKLKEYIEKYNELDKQKQELAYRRDDLQNRVHQLEGKYNELSKELEITAHLRDDLQFKVNQLEEENKTSVICGNKLIEKYNEQEKMLFSLKGVNGRYKKQIARLKEEITELQNDSDDAIEPIM